MKKWICDNCGQEFNQPLDEEKYVDEHGIYLSFDLCAPCRQELGATKEKFMKRIASKGKHL